MVKKVLISGFCANGWHEGTKPKSKSTGQPFAICTVWTTCTCHCHEQITDMYKSLGLPREEAMQNPEYSEWVKAEREKFVMPDPVLARFNGLFIPGGGILPLDDEDPVTGLEPATLGTLPEATPAPVVPAFAPTPTGRRARGQLEADVLKVCQDFVHNVFDWEICTPKLVAEEIGHRYAIEPPSTGAIDAVWNRWQELGFAWRDRKPSRFSGFVGPSEYTYLEGLKVSKKRQARRQIAEQRRGIPRPPKSRSKR
jgi:hypothetical protein